MTLLSNLLLFTPGHSGFSSYVRRVMPAIPGYRLFLNAGDGVECRQDDVLPEQWTTSRWLSLLQRLSLTQHGVNVRAVLSRESIPINTLQVIYSPYCDFLFALPEVPQVITCHDLTPLYFSNSRKAMLRYRYWTPRHLQRATKAIAISRFVADQMMSLGIPASKLEVIPNGITIARAAIKHHGNLDLVMLARHDPNKNVLSILRGFARLLERSPDWPGRLVVVGREGRQTPALHRFLSGWAHAGKVVMLQKVTESDLLRLLRSSLALVSSSRMEGFDYPVLEAKAEGLPTLISDIPVHREFHQGSSLFFHPDVPEDEFADLVLHLALDKDSWKQLSAAGHQLASRLALTQQQAEILSLLNQVTSP